MARVVLAMSGGVDSSVAAYLLKRDGHEVLGVFMRRIAGAPLTSFGNQAPVASSLATGAADVERRQGCSHAAHAEDARRVAERLDIPFHALDVGREFDQIIEYFVDEYVAARTPNPCIVCNNRLKFGKLFDYAERVGAEYVATGHHARLIRPNVTAGRAASERAVPALCRGFDATKDQSYVLFGVNRHRLSKMVFPVGVHKKEEIRRMARIVGLGVADKPDSQEICFVTSGRYDELVRSRRGDRDTSGEIVEVSGRVVGQHEGIERFTIGQRKGLGVALGERRFVVRIEADTQRVVIGTRDQLAAREVMGRQTNWLVDPPTKPRRCRAQIRYNSAALPATVETGPGNRLRVVFEKPCYGVAPGQAIVCYTGPRVMGGGWIETWSPAAAIVSAPRSLG